MPFDATPRELKYQPTSRGLSRAYGLLLRIEATLDGGKRWLQAAQRDGDRHCLLTAFETVCRGDASAEVTAAYLGHAARARFGKVLVSTAYVSMSNIAVANDSCADFEELRELLADTRELVMADLWTSSKIAAAAVMLKHFRFKV